MARELMRMREQLLRSVVDESDPVHILQQKVACKLRGDIGPRPLDLVDDERN